MADQDSGTDGQITYYIASGNSGGEFAIAQNGSLIINKGLDRETASGYTLTIAARDNPVSSSPKSSSIPIVIAISDVNDNTPVFSVPVCQYYVSDDVEIATIVGYVSAIDEDFGKNAEVIYYLSSEFDDYFTYNDATGSIKVNNDLRLTNQTTKIINFTVTASDKGTPQLSISLNCTVTITGENKHGPQLLHAATLTKILPSMVAIGYNITQINATDSDFGPDGEVTFVIISGDINNEFSIDSNGFLSTVKRLQSGFYALIVEIADKASPAKRKSTNCTVVVFVEGKPFTGGKVYVGSMFEDKTFDIYPNKTFNVSVYAQIGVDDLEGLDVHINFDAADADFVAATSDFRVIADSGKIYILGLVKFGVEYNGIQKIADIKFTAKNRTSFRLKSVVKSMLDQHGIYIPHSSKPAPVVCNTVMFGDVNQDCQFDMADISNCQTNVRNKTISKMFDLDKNSLINNMDCSYMFQVLIGRSIAIKETQVKTPNDQADKNCQFEVTVSTFSNTLTYWQPSRVSIYIITSYKSNFMFTKSSNHVAILPTTSGTYKHGEVFKLNQFSNSYQILLNVTKRNPKIGISLLISATLDNKIYFTETFQRNKVSHKIGLNLSLENTSLILCNDYIPQFTTSFNQTTEACLFPVIITKLAITLIANYDEIVKPNKQGFVHNFTNNFVQREKSYGRDIVIKTITVTSGSVVVSMDIEHKEAEKQVMVSQLENDLKDGTFTFTYNGAKMLAKLSLLVDGEETMIPKKADDDDKATIIIAVVVVLVILIIVAILIVCYIKKIKGRRVRASKKDNVMGISTGSKEWFSPRLKKASSVVSPLDFYMEETKINSPNNNSNNNNNNNNNSNDHSGITNCSYAKYDTTLYDFDEEKGSSIHSANASNLNLVSKTTTRESTSVQEQVKQVRKAFDFCSCCQYIFVFSEGGDSLQPLEELYELQTRAYTMSLMQSIDVKNKSFCRLNFFT